MAFTSGAHLPRIVAEIRGYGKSCRSTEGVFEIKAFAACELLFAFYRDCMAYAICCYCVSVTAVMLNLAQSFGDEIRKQRGELSLLLHAECCRAACVKWSGVVVVMVFLQAFVAEAIMVAVEV